MTDESIELQLTHDLTSGRAQDVTDDVNNVVFALQDLRVSYGSYQAVRQVSLTIAKNEITAFIGPSGCGKSTLLRSFNRMNDLIPGARVEGLLAYHGIDIYGPDVDPIEVRRRIGMVFQKPNVFPKSIYDNVAYGPRVNHIKGNMDDLVEECLTKAALWDEVKDDLKKSAYALSGGQQQRLVIARCIAVRPEVILMDEPCASLDPIATAKIEDLMRQLALEFTILIVTHNMQQAARCSDFTAYMYLGDLVEFGETKEIFMKPERKETEDYITGRFG